MKRMSSAPTLWRAWGAGSPCWWGRGLDTHLWWQGNR